jgi:HAD superfamily hydrolase (TIGR01458 family)
VLAAAQWLRAQNKIGKLALFVPVATQPEFAGLPCLADNAETGADYVVVGDLGQGWDYATLNRAFRLLHHNPDAVLVALGMTRYWQTERGVALDVGPFVAALENAAGRKAMVFGKPAASFFQAAAERLGLPAEQLLMIGDDIITDIGGAQSAGLQGALVKTGKFRTSDLAGSVRPDVVLDSIANLPQVWKPATS